MVFDLVITHEKETSDSTYNGWSNYETWCVNLWLCNDEGSDRYWRERAQEAYDDADEGEDRKSDAVHILARELEASHDDQAAEILDGASVFTDLLRASLGAVSWREIAEHLVDEVDEEETEDE